MRIQWFSYVRIVGLSLVLLYHFFTNVFSGGFIGVDIFFTFSGFLITALLVDEYAKHHAIDLKGFYRRRFYRIVPPLVLSILLCLPFTFLVRTDYIASIGRQLVATMGFMTNVYEILTGGSYESNFVPHLFVHTWSLAIEVQFYLFWGFLVWFLAKKTKTANQFRSLIFLLSSVFMVLSCLTMVISALMTSNFSSVYFSTFAHIFPFFIGSITAPLSGVGETTTRFKKNVLYWPLRQVFIMSGISLFLLIVLTFTLNFNNLVTYLVGFLLASLFAAVLIYSMRMLNDKLPGKKELKAVTYLANISYGMYLFHWPLYTIFSQVTNNWLAVILTVMLSMIFSTLSYYVIEPYLAGKPVKLLGVTLAIAPYKKVMYWVTGALVLVLAIVVIRAPRVGDFQLNLTTNTLKQEQNTMNQMRQLANNANATSYNVPQGVTVIGDSVALRASDQINATISNVSVDAAVSRNLSQVLEILQTDAANNALAENVVIAAGANTINNYQAVLDQIVAALPKGHHLIFVTPYDGRYVNVSSAIVNQTRVYEQELANKYDYIVIADWYQTAIDNPGLWSGTDGVHFGADSSTILKGENLYAQTIQSALDTANSRPLKSAAG